MTNTTVLRSIHSTLNSAHPGDCGWLWYEGNWHMSEAYESDNLMFVEIFGSGEFETQSVPITHPDVRSAPWYKVSRPPYEGNERPCTHALTFVDRDASWTMSFSAPEEEGAAISRAVSELVHSLLKIEKATGDAA